MPEGTQVHVSGTTGKPESIHIQRDPMRKRRGYYIKGMTGESREGYWPRRIYDQEVDCGNCLAVRLCHDYGPAWQFLFP